MAQGMRFDPKFFEQIMKSSGVDDLCRVQAEAVLHVADTNAPVDKGEYKAGLKIAVSRSSDRVRYRVVGTDWKTLLVESQTGNLSRALRAVTRGGR